MRVLIFTDEYDLSYYTFIYNEIKYLQQAGLKILVVCERVGKLALNDTESNYICIELTRNKILRTIYLQANKRKWFTFLALLYPYFRKRSKIVKTYQPDLVHFHFGDTATRLFFPLEKTLHGYPKLVSFHGFDASSLLNKTQYLDRIRALLLKKEFSSIAVSKTLQKNLSDKNVSIDKNFLLHYGVNINVFNRTKRKNNTIKKFVQISNFVEKKGHTYTLQAFKLFIEKNPGKAKLILGGNGPLHTEIVNQSISMGLENDVEFPGWISRESAVSFLENADYFVHHSITASDGDQEGLPNSIIEAMAMELPILSTYHSGIPEIVEHGVNGYLVEEKDVDAYAKSMEAILQWSFLPSSREKVLHHFSLEAHTQSLINIYQKITGHL